MVKTLINSNKPTSESLRSFTHPIDREMVSNTTHGATHRIVVDGKTYWVRRQAEGFCPYKAARTT